MIWYILLAVAGVFVVIALIASTKPDEWTVQRQGTIPSAPATVFPHLEDVNKFLKWSPWAKNDPNMKVTYGVPLTGKGANFSWVGNSKVGAGMMTITESRPNDLVASRFDFSKPICCTNNHAFTLKPEGSQTIVTWTMNGKSPFYFKMILVFASSDKMMGDDLELGLANLRAVVAG
jgi:hypothetical protein